MTPNIITDINETFAKRLFLHAVSSCAKLSLASAARNIADRVFKLPAVDAEEQTTHDCVCH